MVRSLDRALILLETLGATPGGVALAELSKRVGLHASTAHRLLKTLAARGYVQQNPETGRYALAPQALYLAMAYLSQLDLRRLVLPVLERLSQATGETANLALLDQGEALYVEKVDSVRSLRIFSRIGRRAPLHCTAVGKVLLAYRPRTEVVALLGGGPLERLTEHTITGGDQLNRELEKVRDQGFALDWEECEEGACCIAVPIRNAAGQVEAALSISAPSVRVTPRRMEELLPIILRAGEEISTQLGFRGFTN